MDPDHFRALLDAHRARLTTSVLRGLSHEVANSVQMLSLDAPSAGALEAARERLTRAAALLASLARADDPDPGPSLLPEIMAEVLQWQALQSGLPEARIDWEAPRGLPALAMGHGLARTLLLLVMTCAKTGGARRIVCRAEITTEGVRIEFRGDGLPPPEAALAGFVSAAGASWTADAADRQSLVLPAAPVRGSA